LVGGVRLLSRSTPAPRLLVSVVPDVRAGESLPHRAGMKSRLKGASLFSGNGWAIFLGMFAGAALLSTIGVLYSRHRAAVQHEEAQRKLLPAVTHSVFPFQHPEASLAPIMVQLHADLIHVTAISLGHPRLAIINNQQVSEGALLTVHPPNTSVTLTLRVLKIGDGRIELSDGTQVIVARLELAKPPVRH
jgi:hypothetical protein